MDDAIELLVDALALLGFEARPADAADARGDLVLEPGGVTMAVEVERRALVTDDVAARLLDEVAGRSAVLMIVGDRVTESARRLLNSRGGGYYDLRGRLAVRTDRVVIDAEVDPVLMRPGRTSALSGKAGIEVATALLMQPDRPATVRGLARELDRSPSTVSEVLTALRRDVLIDEQNAILDNQLFWQVAERWHGPTSYLANVPSADDEATAQALRLGPRVKDGDDSVGWALTDTVAAVAYGAPAATRSGQTLHFYLPDATTLRRATTLLGASVSATQAACVVRAAPVPAICRRRVVLGSPGDWPLAHPVFVALDLAQDVGRGREILADWTPGEHWRRVW